MMKFVACVVFSLCLASSAFAQCWYEDHLSHSGSVAILHRDTAAIGVKQDNIVYLYKFDGLNWIEYEPLQPLDLQIYDDFGTSVAMIKNTIIVGAPDWWFPYHIGAAYIFRFNGTSWIEEQKLTASDTFGNNWFGQSVSISNNVAIIGAPIVKAAYIFRFDGTSWIEEQKITALDVLYRDRFGNTVAISGDVAIVGALGNASAYIFRFNGTRWVEEQKLTAFDYGFALFGPPVSISDNVAVLGGLYNDIDRIGSAYIFRFNGTNWVEEQKLDAEGMLLGSVSISGDTVIVGDRDFASVFRFDGTNWVEEIKLACDGNCPVAVSGQTFIAGSYIYEELTCFDFDGNGIIDIDDMAHWESCQVEYTAGCSIFDSDNDDDIDLRDFAAFARNFSPINP